VIDGRAVTIEIDADLCVAIYDAQIGAGRLVRRDLLESAVAAPFAGFGGCEAYPTLIEKAARLAYGIAEAQAYEDGNKRLAWLSTVVFLEINDVVVEAEHRTRPLTLFVQWERVTRGMSRFSVLPGSQSGSFAVAANVAASRDS